MPYEKLMKVKFYAMPLCVHQQSACKSFDVKLLEILWNIWFAPKSKGISFFKHEWTTVLNMHIVWWICWSKCIIEGEVSEKDDLKPIYIYIFFTILQRIVRIWRILPLPTKRFSRFLYSAKKICRKLYKLNV